MTLEWRGADNVRFREDPLSEGTRVPGTATGRYFVYTHYDAASSVIYPPLVSTDDEALYVAKYQRNLLLRGHYRDKRRAAFVHNTWTLRQPGVYAFSDQLSSTLVYREEVLEPSRNYTHVILCDGRIWASWVCPL